MPETFNKRTRFNLGVRQKVLLLLLTVLLVALTVSGWMALQAEKDSTLQEINQRGKDISRFVAKSLSFSVIGYDYHTIDLLLEEIITSEEIGYVKVVNRKGNTMSEVGNDPGKSTSEMIVFEEPITIADEIIGSLFLGLSTKTTLQRLESQKYTLIKREAFIILLIAIGEFLALSYVIIRPVSIISESLDDQDHKDGQIVGNIPIVSNDEFGELAKRFNRLSNNLNKANSELRSRADFADKRLVDTNNILQSQSEELKKMNKELERLAITDPLTNLYNRRHFEQTLSTEISVSERHGDTNSLIMFDIDNFKNVNDSYGHETGDIVIKEVARVMNNRLRNTDLLCRIGGEEFACLCKRADKHSATNIAEYLRNTIEEHKIDIGDKKISVTISAGVATITRYNMDSHAKNIYKYSDKALYHSKQHGRNRVSHYDDIVV